MLDIADENHDIEPDSPAVCVRNLRIVFDTGGREAVVVPDLSFDVRSGGIMAILGESGSGKSLTALSILNILPTGGRIASGQILFAGRDLTLLSDRDMEAIRGARISMIFQDALASLNPVMTIGTQISEGIRRHTGVSSAAAKTKAIDLLQQVGLPEAARRYHDYPHQLSGGQRQRVMIAMAVSLGPDLLIADEPTTALDVSIQAQILDLIAEMRESLNMTVVLITHDLSVTWEYAERVCVMYAGDIVEEGPVKDVLLRPYHPYTLGLIGSIPHADGNKSALIPISGSPPDSLDDIQGCAFAARCRFAQDICTVEAPLLRTVGRGRSVRCHFAEQVYSDHSHENVEEAR